MSAPNVNPNNRASLLAGLRTGGVRSASMNTPHSAAPAGAFNNLAPFPSINVYSEDEDFDQISEMPHTHRSIYNNRNVPLTAAVDGANNRFSAHQALNAVPFTPSQMLSGPQIQMQMMQLELMRQAMQAQQFQAEIIAQAQIQQQAAQARERRSSLAFNPPSAAGPLANSFHGQARRPNQAELLRAQLGVGTPSMDHVPMSAAIGGRFGTRSTSANAEYSASPAVPTVIGGGGSSPPGNVYAVAAAAATPSKSDAASSWRRSGNNSVLAPNRTVSSPGIRASPRPVESHRGSPPPESGATTTHLGIKFRPQPLRFSPAASQPLPTVSIDITDEDTDGETHSSDSSVNSLSSKSSPTTPRSTASHEMPLSPREEASKKLFEGLGISRPVSATPSDQGQQHQQPITVSTSNSSPAPGHRLVSQPTRQPRGPPSGADELGPKNFATRIRRKAIGGLGMLIGSRDHREVVEAF